MKGQTVLEYPFKVLLYFFIAIVIIGLVVTFRNQIFSFNLFNLCQYTPQGCQKEKCSVRLVKEKEINESLLRKYCKLCSEETEKKDYKEDCLCFVVSGEFHPIDFNQENCELTCDKDTTSIQIIYYHLLKKIYIKC